MNSKMKMAVRGAVSTCVMADDDTSLSDEERVELEELRAEKAEREKRRNVAADRAELERLKADRAASEADRAEQRRIDEAKERGRRLMDQFNDALGGNAYGGDYIVDLAFRFYALDGDSRGDDSEDARCASFRERGYQMMLESISTRAVAATSG